MNNLNIVSAYVGSDQVERLYLGSDIIWEMTQPEPVVPLPPIEDATYTPLSFLMLDDGYVGLRCLSGLGAYQASQVLGTPKSLVYEIYGPGFTPPQYWETGQTTVSSGTLTISNQSFGQTELVFVPSGYTICFFGPNNTQLGLASYSSTTMSALDTKWCFDAFYVSGSASNTALVYGNTISILMTEWDFMRLQTGHAPGLLPYSNPYWFGGLFYDYNLPETSKIAFPSNIEDTFKVCESFGLIGIGNLRCFYQMFMGCQKLTKAPMFPSGTYSLGPYCCYEMFRGCTNLTTAPEFVLQEDGDYDYDIQSVERKTCSSMFRDCTSLTTAPELPATSLSGSCYEFMFAGCTSLTQAPSILPATTLYSSCYQWMFKGCTSLTTAPELPAPTLANSSYAAMFQGCTSLNYVKCLATTGFNQAPGWLSGVSPTGTFVKHPNATWTTGGDGIPDGWTVQDATV
jgi:hypothetical protein